MFVNHWVSRAQQLGTLAGASGRPGILYRVANETSIVPLEHIDATGP
jgi:hypothetical protein